MHAVGPTKPPSLSTLDLISPGVNWPRRETDYSPAHLRVRIYGMVPKFYCLLLSFLFGKKFHLLVCFFLSSIHNEAKFSYSHGATRLSPWNRRLQWALCHPPENRWILWRIGWMITDRKNPKTVSADANGAMWHLNLFVFGPVPPSLLDLSETYLWMRCLRVDLCIWISSKRCCKDKAH
jgi:hypothetical protein